MSGVAIALLGFVAMLGLIALRAPIGLAMLLVGAFGYSYLQSPEIFFNYMKTNSYHQFSNYTLSVVPLFILMGAFAERAGIAKALFKAAEGALGRYRGGLAMAVIGACTAFGAICGSSVATTATFGRAALPELDAYRYDGGLSTGVIAVGGTLGILIPPSVILVVYAITTEQNIAKLFQAALIPGLLAAISYCLVIAYVVWRKPALAPSTERLKIIRPPQPLWPRIVGPATALLGAGLWVAGMLDDAAAILAVVAGLVIAFTQIAIMPAILLAIVVVGGIYGGIFTPTEGAAIGAITMLIIGLAQRSLSREDIIFALKQTAETAGMIFFILLGSEVFGAFLALSRLPTIAADMIAGSGFSPYIILIGILAFYIALGAVMDELAMILLTLPVFFPIVQGLDFGMSADDAAIWFGILVLMVVGIGLTAPPIGLNVFVISSIARKVPLSSIYRGVMPFIVADVMRLALVVIFPGIALGLMRWLS